MQLSEEHVRRSAMNVPQALAVKLLAIFSSAFAIHYYVLHELLGLLAVDEIYFAHVFWLMQRGQEIYVDFYANHLPTYFYLLSPLLPGSAAS